MLTDMLINHILQIRLSTTDDVGKALRQYKDWSLDCDVDKVYGLLYPLFSRTISISKALV
jgi:hypothetical protein